MRAIRAITLAAALGGPAPPPGSDFVTLDLATRGFARDIRDRGPTGDIVDPGAHVHGPADVGQTAGVQAFFAGGASGAPLPQPSSGRPMGSTVLSADRARDVRAGQWHVSIHTATNRSGEIRGRAIPAPAGAAVLGLAGLTAPRRRR
ncbi:MAG: CHRD domain-containing protein [Phycisphaerales bacterium]